MSVVRVLMLTPWFSSSRAFHAAPAPTPKRKRPPVKRSIVAISLAKIIGSRWTTRQMPVPSLSVEVTEPIIAIEIIWS